jgi:5S rRNA maturation endonuclease (ribonuclease M5)
MEPTKKDIGRLVSDLNNPHILGLDAREVFFSEEKAVVVEGQEDVILIRRISSQLGVQPPTSLFGWGAGGADKVKLILSILRDLGVANVTTLVDKDKEEVSRALQEAFPEYKHFVLAADDIRDKREQKSRPAKVEVCEENGELKSECRDTMKTLLEQISSD